MWSKEKRWSNFKIGGLIKKSEENESMIINIQINYELINNYGFLLLIWKNK